jgi:ATP-dependent DNA helicase RecQ
MPKTLSRPDEKNVADDAPSTTPESVLRERFGLPGFRPGQRQVIDCLLERGGALAVFPTGGGSRSATSFPRSSSTG